PRPPWAHRPLAPVRPGAWNPGRRQCAFPAPRPARPTARSAVAPGHRCAAPLPDRPPAAGPTSNARAGRALRRRPPGGHRRAAGATWALPTRRGPRWKGSWPPRGGLRRSLDFPAPLEFEARVPDGGPRTRLIHPLRLCGDAVAEAVLRLSTGPLPRHDGLGDLQAELLRQEPALELNGGLGG